MPDGKARLSPASAGAMPPGSCSISGLLQLLLNTRMLLFPQPHLLQMPGAIIDFEVGDTVTVVEGVWEGTVGKIRSINESKQSVTINVDMFGRETPVDFPFEHVHKM